MTNKLKITELFAGIGSQVAALKRIGADYETVGISEIDKYAIKSYEAMNGVTRNYGDITKVERLDYTDLLVYSSPCFTADTLILTETRGYQPIVDIVVGEKVLTHDGSYKTVTNAFCTGTKPTVEVFGKSFGELTCTPNHKFYVRSKGKNGASYDDPHWVEARDLVSGDLLGFPINSKSVLPDISEEYPTIASYMHEESFWYFIGLLVGKRSFQLFDYFGFVCSLDDIAGIAGFCSCFGGLYQKFNCEQYTLAGFNNIELLKFVQQFGSIFMDKHIPQFILDLPVAMLRKFLNGYFAKHPDEDELTGWLNGETAFEGNYRVCLELVQCYAKVFKVIPELTPAREKWWEQRYRLRNPLNSSIGVFDDFVWTEFYGYATSGEREVYDLTVEDNHSFVANNCIVHNCTDFSLAGKQKGLIDENGEKTRSGLLLDVARLLMRMNDEHILPKYLLMENVKNLVGKKFKPAFDIWLKALDALGYNNYWKVLNAKDYGVPQNRERVFVVSIRKDIDTHGYTFPKPFKLTRRLKNVLETNVDECYYLRDELVEKFVKRLKARAEKKTDGEGGTDINDLNVVSEPLVAASRGRNPENPLNRESGLPTEQQLEINETGCSNTLTTVGKDNLVVEPNVLVAKRTEYGKSIRKDYEAGRIQESRHNMTELEPRTDGASNTLTTEQKDNLLVEPTIKLVGNAYYPDKNYGPAYAGSTYDPSDIVGTLTTMGGGNREPLIIQNAHGYNNGGVKEIAPELTSGGNYTQTNFVIDSTQKNAYVGSMESVSPCLTEAMSMGGGQFPMVSVQLFNTCKDGSAHALTAHLHKETINDCTKLDRHSPATGVMESTNQSIRIRKLTAKECWRLMDFTDEEFEAAQKAGVSKTQLYKQAGNSIVVSCLAHIFTNLLTGTEFEPENGFKTDWKEALENGSSNTAEKA